jgi:glutathione synthase/RimK-type ligase-like ATP-grasp enzyme
MSRIEARVVDGHVTGRLSTPESEVPLESVTAVFTRLMDDSRLPDVEDEPAGSARRLACRRFHATLAEWIEVAPVPVLTRARPQSSNASKPYQAQRILASGFDVPETLITNDPDEVRSFLDRHGRIIYKSASGVRSIVRELAETDLERLDDIRWCPVQFQEYVAGRDVRAHVVAGEVFATDVASDGVDYRYAPGEGGTTTLSEAALPDHVTDACRILAESLELPLAGIDLRIGDDGRVVCFEVNPSPGFSYYEGHTGQPISAAIARYLAGA